jgi:hypothetical protein
MLAYRGRSRRSSPTGRRTTERRRQARRRGSQSPAPPRRPDRRWPWADTCRRVVLCCGCGCVWVGLLAAMGAVHYILLLDSLADADLIVRSNMPNARRELAHQPSERAAGLVFFKRQC